jgi:thiamine-monophosphate kinase
VPSELELIQTFVRATGAAPLVPAGPGDDAAVLAPSGASCVTVDALVEGVHFRRATASLEDIGHKALAVNLSDLAAMGARPRWCLVALGLPRGFRRSEARAMGRGLGGLARAAGVKVVGGNVTRAPGLSLTVTVGGEAPDTGLLLRSGARVGDALWVSGTLGDARLGLLLLESRGNGPGGLLRRHPRLARGTMGRQRRPTARVALGQALAGLATACIDLSDGLAQDAARLAMASRAQLHIRLGELPTSRALSAAIPEPGARNRFAAMGGEDYELLFTAPPDVATQVLRRGRRARVQVRKIGEVVWGRGTVLVDERGRPVRGVHGFQHFTR